MMAAKPVFRMQDAHKLSRLKPRWRRPRGKDSKMRRHLVGYCASPSHGYQSPKALRGKVRGLEPVLVANAVQLSMVDPKRQIVIVSSSLGMRNRLSLLRMASEKGMAVQNFRDIGAFVEAQQKALEARKVARQKNAEKKVAKARKAEQKVEEKKEQPSRLEEAVSEEEKKKLEKQEKDKVLIQKE